MATARAPYEPIVIGADIGNATTSITTAAGVASFFPSAITRTSVKAYQSMGKMTSTSRHHITYQGRHAVIGADAFEMRGYDTLLAENTSQPQKRYTDDESFLCFLAGVSAAFPSVDTLGVKVGTGAPLSIFEAYGADIARRYEGKHEYSYNGRNRTLIVDRVHVFGEGREAWRLLSDEHQRGNVAVHDLGGKTWNVLLFKDGILRAFRTFDMGTERILDDVEAVPTDAAVRWVVQSQMRSDPKAHKKIRAGVEAVIASFLPVIERKVALDQATRHALIGGGAVYLPAALERRYSVPAVILNGEAPESVNALAYALAAAEVK